MQAERTKLTSESKFIVRIPELEDRLEGQCDDRSKAQRYRIHG
jgi:hypothetical protein